MKDERIERYLISMAVTFERVSEDVWLINDPDRGLSNIVLFVDDSLLTIRTRVMPIPTNDTQQKCELYKDLLTLNCDLVHGAYAIEDNFIILMDTLELDTMDLEELQASLDAISLGLAQHYSQLNKYLPGHVPG